MRKTNNEEREMSQNQNPSMIDLCDALRDAFELLGSDRVQEEERIQVVNELAMAVDEYQARVGEIDSPYVMAAHLEGVLKTISEGASAILEAHLDESE